MKLVRWSPARDLLNIQDEMNRVMDRFFSPELFEGSDFSTSRWLPNMDVQEDKDRFTISMELPGLSKADVILTVREGVLTIEGERKQEDEKEGVNYHRVERRYGKFLRSFQLPVRVQEDKIEAVFKEGVLTVQIPKAEEVKPKQIAVKIA
ncbi:MAG: Hsp20/alpha crystallin family protein [Calditrichaceae bacterium]|nr:Hsp20/alpha crystallin family protein [Calditrichia bacterium]NUQ39957.1 Hsp20/alpha crystallin family protein [Calditrichaceae bacterium]